MVHFSYVLVLLSLIYVTITSADQSNNNPQNQCKVALDSAQEAGILAYDEINVRIKQAKSPELKNMYKPCLGNYGRANIAISIAGDLLNSKSYQIMVSKVSSAIAEADACDKSLAEEPISLKQATKTFQDVSRKLLVIVKRLAGE